MLDWDKLRIFHTAAESGSFTHAAEKLNMSQSAVSRQISAPVRFLPSPSTDRIARRGRCSRRSRRASSASLATTISTPLRCSAGRPSASRSAAMSGRSTFMRADAP